MVITLVKKQQQPLQTPHTLYELKRSFLPSALPFAFESSESERDSSVQSNLDFSFFSDNLTAAAALVLTLSLRFRSAKVLKFRKKLLQAPSQAAAFLSFSLSKLLFLL